MEKKYRAKLDASDIYWGVEQIDELAVGDIEVPEDCDLKHGHYRWDEPSMSFLPLGKRERRDTPESPLTERALYELLVSLPTTPEYCVEWVKWYRTTLDMKGVK